MRFNEFITEAKLDPEIMAVFHNAYAQCRPFLEQIDMQPGKYMMLRGMKDRSYPGHGLPDDVGIKYPRLDGRTPMDTPDEIHELTNVYFTQKHGHPYRNGLFVTGNISTAQSYGKPYAVFPIGKFDYIWNENVNDFTTDVVEDIVVTSEHEVDGPELEHVENAMRRFGPYTDSTGLPAALGTGVEVMVWCESYYYMTTEIAMKFQKFISK